MKTIDQAELEFIGKAVADLVSLSRKYPKAIFKKALRIYILKHWGMV